MENQVILSKKNCHRAATVRQIEHPEYGEWLFEWRGQDLGGNMMRRDYAHIASRPGFGDSIVIYDNELSMWEILSWKYEVNLEELWDAAYNAFNCTSFVPDERATQYIRDYEKELNYDLTNMPENEKERYITKYKDWVRTLFSKHSRIMSAMITGPARFPTRRNEKANNSYDASCREFREWREKALKAITRRIEEAKPAEQRENEEWLRLKRSIYSSACTIKGINEGTERGCNKALFVSSIYGKVETYAKRGDVATVEKAIAYVRELNKQSSIITERHKFFKLVEMAKVVCKAQEEKTNKEDVEIEFEGGKVVKNFSEDRLQIIFPGKPDSETISKLKSNGFRWSPRFMAWQRQLTDNSYYACARVVPVTVEQLKTA
mgnify:FL=1|jgi:hypothetical protein